MKFVENHADGVVYLYMSFPATMRAEAFLAVDEGFDNLPRGLSREEMLLQVEDWVNKRLTLRMLQHYEEIPLIVNKPLGLPSQWTCRFTFASTEDALAFRLKHSGEAG